MNVPPETYHLALQGIRVSGVGMLAGTILATLAGLLSAKRHIALPLSIIIVFAVLSAVANVVMVSGVLVGVLSMMPVGLLQPFALLMPAFGFNNAENAAVEKRNASAEEKSAEADKPYSYLEAYKNKRK